MDKKLLKEMLLPFVEALGLDRGIQMWGKRAVSTIFGGGYVRPAIVALLTCLAVHVGGWADMGKIFDIGGRTWMGHRAASDQGRLDLEKESFFIGGRTVVNQVANLFVGASQSIGWLTGIDWFNGSAIITMLESVGFDTTILKMDTSELVQQLGMNIVQEWVVCLGWPIIGTVMSYALLLTGPAGWLSMTTIGGVITLINSFCVAATYHQHGALTAGAAGVAIGLGVMQQIVEASRKRTDRSDSADVVKMLSAQLDDITRGLVPESPRALMAQVEGLIQQHVARRFSTKSNK